MTYLNAKYIRNKSVSEGKHLHVLRKHLAAAVDNTSVGETIAVKLHRHRLPNLQGQQLKGRELTLLLCCQKGKKAHWQHIHYQYSLWWNDPEFLFFTTFAKTKHLFNVINVQCGTHRTNLVNGRAEELAVLYHNINLKN